MSVLGLQWRAPRLWLPGPERLCVGTSLTGPGDHGSRPVPRTGPQAPTPPGDAASHHPRILPGFRSPLRHLKCRLPDSRISVIACPRGTRRPLGARADYSSGVRPLR